MFLISLLWSAVDQTKLGGIPTRYNPYIYIHKGGENGEIVKDEKIWVRNQYQLPIGRVLAGRSILTAGTPATAKQNAPPDPNEDETGKKKMLEFFNQDEMKIEILMEKFTTPP